MGKAGEQRQLPAAPTRSSCDVRVANADAHFCRQVGAPPRQGLSKELLGCHGENAATLAERVLAPPGCVNTTVFTG